MSMAIKRAMNKKKHARSKRDADEKGVHKSGSGGIHSSTAGDLARVGKKLKDKGDRARVYGEKEAGDNATNLSKDLHREKLSELKEMGKQDRTNLAEGGCVSCAAGRCMAHGGIVDRIMAKREAADDESVADEMPNDFDYLELEPAPTADYPEEDGEDDLVGRIIKKRARSA